ncbi:hypothetical protein JCM9279_000481 [Rhodotorula babjevae]
MRSFPTLVATLAAIPSALAFTYSVGVGKSEVTGEPAYAGFDPSRIVISDATTSNQIDFLFLGGTHRVVQVTPDQPCAYAGGFDSGVQRVAAGTLQGQGPTVVYQIENNTDVLYFADIGEDYSPCYLGAIFCVNSVENSDTACHTVIDAAKALGVQYGVTTAPSTASSTSAAASSASSASDSAASSASTTAASTSSAASSGASSSSRAPSASGSAPAASQSAGSNGAGALKVAVGAMALVGGAAALLA